MTISEDGLNYVTILLSNCCSVYILLAINVLLFFFVFCIQDGLTGIISIMTDIIWRYTGNFMAPDIVCRVVRYLQVSGINKYCKNSYLYYFGTNIEPRVKLVPDIKQQLENICKSQLLVSIVGSCVKGKEHKAWRKVGKFDLWDQAS